MVSPPNEAWTKALELSYSTQILFYDAIYLGFAQALKSPLVTADAKLIESVPSTNKANVVHLTELVMD
jgi:predicted nucleic acid-binding protein